MNDVDNSNLCFGCHWNTTLREAIDQFQRWGFNGIHEFSKERVLNGNDARNEVIANAKAQNAKYYFNGSYDWNVGDDSAVYRFRFSSYTGELVDGDNADIRYAADWSGHK